jgi:hypothetical protein
MGVYTYQGMQNKEIEFSISEMIHILRSKGSRECNELRNAKSR